MESEPHIPAICDFRQAAIAFGFACCAPYPFTLPGNFFSDVIAHDSEGKALGTCLETAVNSWNNGEYPIEVGEHRNIPIFNAPEVRTDNGHGMLVPVSLTANLLVHQQLFFGHFPITEMSGFRDEIRGGIITNAFTVGMLDPETITTKWKPLVGEADAPIAPAIRLVGLWGWPS